MYEARSKDLILRRVREALAKGGTALPPAPDLIAPIHPPLGEDLVEAFVQNFIAAGGTFVYCDSDDEFFEQLRHFKHEHHLDTFHVWEPALREYLTFGNVSYTESADHFVQDAPAGLTTCEALLARTGSMIITSGTASGRRLSVYPEIHLVVAHASQIVTDIKPALEMVRAQYGRNLPSMISLVTGPSRTADIEKTLVLGAHGPRQLVLFLIDDSPAQASAEADADAADHAPA